jgi:L-amino acid N-acyltransferase YncA
MDKEVTLKNNVKVTIREMTTQDVDRSLAFFQALPEDDRAYLRRPVTDREAVTRRIDAMTMGRVLRLVAVVDDEIVADGALELATQGWKEHIAEIRLIVARPYQGKGLGELMAMELYNLASRRRVEEILVEMMGPQAGVQRIFKRLGFQKVAEIQQFVKDIHGEKQDLILMRCKLAELWDKLEEHITASDWHQKI